MLLHASFLLLFSGHNDDGRRKTEKTAGNARTTLVTSRGNRMTAHKKVSALESSLHHHTRHYQFISCGTSTLVCNSIYVTCCKWAFEWQCSLQQLSYTQRLPLCLAAITWHCSLCSLQARQPGKALLPSVAAPDPDGENKRIHLWNLRINKHSFFFTGNTCANWTTDKCLCSW